MKVSELRRLWPAPEASDEATVCGRWDDHSGLFRGEAIRVYVLIREHGEYEQWSRDVLGVYSSETAARAAIPKPKEEYLVESFDLELPREALR